MPRRYEIKYIRSIYIYSLSVTVSQSKSKPSQGRSRPEPHPGGQWPLWNPVENLSSRKQRCVALNMESQHGLRKGQYSSPPAVFNQLLPSPCLSPTRRENFREVIKGEIYFCDECFTVSSALHY